MIFEAPSTLSNRIADLIWHNLDIAVLGPIAAYFGTMAKGWIEKTNIRSEQANLCEEADRLIKFHATLSAATVPTLKMQSAQAAVVCQLNHVLEKLSRTLTEPVGSRNSASSLRSNLIVRTENGLLLYRPLGIWSALLHVLFYLMVPLWCFILVVFADPHTPDLTKTERIVSTLVCAVPLVLCNLLARKVDSWARGKNAVRSAKVADSGPEIRGSIVPKT